jgi:hypothetical protein
MGSAPHAETPDTKADSRHAAAWKDFPWRSTVPLTMFVVLGAFAVLCIFGF